MESPLLLNSHSAFIPNSLPAIFPTDDMIAPVPVMPAQHQALQAPAKPAPMAMPVAVAPPAPRELPPPAMTRAERVARYLEKRKRRKFEKTIRYASRKAYAEVSVGI